MARHCPISGVCRVGAMLAGLVLANLAPAADVPLVELAKVEDDKPLRSAGENPDEYRAFNTLVLRARKTPSEELARAARPGVTGRELYGAERQQYRGQVVHVTGRLTKLTRIEADAPLAAEGVKNLYQAWVQDDTTTEFPVCVFVSELPRNVQPAEKIEKVWVTLDGYFLKRLAYRDGSKNRLAPLVIGGSLRRSDASTEVVAKTPLEQGDPRLDCPKTWLEHIEDDTAIQNVKANADEYNAYNFFVLHARKVPPDLLAKHARPELTFRVLFQGDRGKYRGEIIHVEGKLLRLEWIGSNSALEAAGVKDLWEAWIFEEVANGNPTCVVLSELPPNIKAAAEIRNTRASFNGYFFKRYKYKAADATRLAPMAIGRTITVEEAPPPTGSASEYDSLLRGIVPVGIIVVVGLAVALVALTWWFRRGDRQVRARLGELKSQALFRDQPPGESGLRSDST